ncbi:MAG TPA: enterochelin esterase [Candidatus Limnocylindrales bacterium]|nr:enterochelin esterase [Candidatus Limnocylindrales bacterium]
MLIELDDDPRYRRVTFRWSPQPGARVPKEVVLRLGTMTDRAFAEGKLASFLFEREGDGWFKTMRLRSDLRCVYRFFLDFEDELRAGQPSRDDWYGRLSTESTVADPLNPLTFPPIGGDDGLPSESLLELPDAPPQPWWRPRDSTRRGTVTRYELTSSILGNTRRVWIYRPAGHDAIDDRVALAVVLDGDCWIDIDLQVTLDNLIAEGRIPPTVAVMVDSMDQTTRMRELTGDGHATFLRFLLEELLPWVRERERFTDDPARTVIAGQSMGGLTAAYVGLHAPQWFGSVLTQSGSFWWPRGSEFDVDGRALIREFVAAPAVPVRFYQEAGLLEWLLLDVNRHMRDVLLAKGYDVNYREYHGGHDWACWRGGIADGLIALLGSR